MRQCWCNHSALSLPKALSGCLIVPGVQTERAWNESFRTPEHRRQGRRVQKSASAAPDVPRPDKIKA